MSKRKNCKFFKQCSYFDASSVTCTNKGGSYCGQYRQYQNEILLGKAPKSSKYPNLPKTYFKNQIQIKKRGIRVKMSENWFMKHAEGWTYKPSLKHIKKGEGGKSLSAKKYKKLQEEKAGKQENCRNPLSRCTERKTMEVKN